MLISTRESPYELNPQIPHATQPRRGERWCLSMYTTRNATQADEEVKKALRKLRFPLSRRGESRTLGAVLHVGDDCDDMSFRREPHESPDDMSPTPCATTPQLHESTKPIECSVPDTSLHEPSGLRQGHVYVSTEDQGGVCLGLGGGLAVEGTSGRSSEGAVGGGSAAEGQCIDPAAQLEEVEQDRTQDDLPESWCRTWEERTTFTGIAGPSPPFCWRSRLGPRMRRRTFSRIATSRCPTEARCV